MDEFERCVQTGRLERVAPDVAWVSRELEAAGYDLARARRSLRQRDAKWAIVQGYYAMFHAAKAMVLSAGYREKSHVCLAIALRHIFVDGGRLDDADVERLVGALELRNQADYDLTYSMDVASIVVDDAASLLSKARRITG